MRFRPLSHFAAAYSGASLQVRKKSRILASLALGFGAVSLALALLMAATGAAVVAGVFVALVLFCGAVLAMLRAGRYNAAASAFLYALFAAMFVAIKFDQYVSVYESYVFGTLGCFLLLATTLIAQRPAQAVVIGVLDLAAIQALYWLDAFPADGGKVTVLATQNLAVSSILTAIGTVIAAWFVNMTNSLVNEIELGTVRAERSFDELNAAMGEAQSSSLRIGESLSASMSRTSASIDSLRERVQDIALGMDELDGAMVMSGDATRKAGESRGEVKAALAAYSGQVTRASSAIQEMAAAALSLASQAEARKAAVGELVETSRAGEGLIDSMSRSMAQIQESAGRVADLGAIIGDVADRTNLLGMNASIEAAHAGAAGRGFAVIANEIRALSVEAGKSARVIGDTLKEAQSAIASTASRSGEVLSSFKRISVEIRGVSLMIEELLASIRELSSGSGQAVQAVQAVAELTGSTERTVESSFEGMSESLKGLAAVAVIAARVRIESSEMSTRFDQMREDSDEVRALGVENLGTVQALKSSLDGFARRRGEPGTKPAAPGPARGRRGQISRGIAVKRSPTA